MMNTTMPARQSFATQGLSQGMASGTILNGGGRGLSQQPQMAQSYGGGGWQSQLYSLLTLVLQQLQQFNGGNRLPDGGGRAPQGPAGPNTTGGDFGVPRNTPLTDPQILSLFQQWDQNIGLPPGTPVTADLAQTSWGFSGSSTVLRGFREWAETAGFQVS